MNRELITIGAMHLRVSVVILTYGYFLETMLEFVISLKFPTEKCAAKVNCRVIDSATGLHLGNISIINQNETDDEDISFIQSLEGETTQKLSATSTFSGETSAEECCKKIKVPKLEKLKKTECNKSPVVTRRRKTGYTAISTPLELVEESLDVDCVSVSSKSLESGDESNNENVSLNSDDSHSEPVSSRRSATPPRRTPKRKSGYPMVKHVASNSSHFYQDRETVPAEKMRSSEFENLSKDFHKFCGVRRRSSASVEIFPYNFENDRRQFRCRSCDFNSMTEAAMKRHVSKCHHADHLAAKKRKSICKKEIHRRPSKSSYRKADSSQI